MDIIGILANPEAYKAAGRYNDRLGSSSANWFLLVAVAAIVLLWVLLFYWDKFRKQFAKRADNPQMLFVDLCKIHGLTLAEKSLLMKVINMAHLTQPSLVFIDPRIIGTMTESSNSEAADYDKLSKKLFAGHAPQ
jgi:di/tricarboxylate transporter